MNIVIDVFRVGLKLDVADEEEDGKQDGGGDLEHGPRRVESRVICPYMVIMSIYGNNVDPIGLCEAQGCCLCGDDSRAEGGVK